MDASPRQSIQHNGAAFANTVTQGSSDDHIQAGQPPGQQFLDQESQSQQAETQQPPGATESSQANRAQGISADEIALYDRQIRLWGVDAQQKLRTSAVLLIGMKGLANEVAKNLVLAGIGSLTIVDDGLVTEEDLGAQFFVRKENVGMIRSQAALPRIQRLNPRVSLQISTLAALFADASIFGAFTLVIATDMSLSDLSTINAACRVQGRPFYAASTFGMYGYIFADLISHDFVISREKSNLPTKLGPESPTRSIIAASSSKQSDGKTLEIVTKRELYTPLILANTSPLPARHLSSGKRKMAVTPLLSCLRALWEYQSQTNLQKPSHSVQDLALFTTLATNKHKELQLPTETLRAELLRSFLQNLGSEISPVCAFLGGQLAQDVINVIGGKGQPIQNMLIFDGDDFKGVVYALHTDAMLSLPLQTGVPLPSLDMPGMGSGIHMPMMGVSLEGLPLAGSYESSLADGAGVKSGYEAK